MQDSNLNVSYKLFGTHVPNGVYFYELLQDGVKLKGGKFIIQH